MGYVGGGSSRQAFNPLLEDADMPILLEERKAQSL
jgi:hypothetical protein